MDNEYNYYKPENNDNMNENKEEKVNSGNAGEVNFVLQPSVAEESEGSREQQKTAENSGAQQRTSENTGEQQRAAGSSREQWRAAGAAGGNPVSHGPAGSRHRPKKKHHGAVKVAACVGLAVVFGVVASATYQTSNYITERLLGKNSSGQNTTAQANTTKVNRSTSVITSDVTEIVNDAMPSVVSITNMSVQEVQNFFGGKMQQESQSSGSGVIIGKNDTELLILTNNHVIENSSSLTVSFIDNESVEGAVKGTDASRDVAVVAVPLESIKSSTMDKISVATIGDSSTLQVGEPAIAIGNALGYGQSVTTGIISAVDRELEGFEGKLIQTDAAINPGNSGGALLNANGEVIGINTVKISSTGTASAEGMGFAIPLSDISGLLENLMNKETRTKVADEERGYLGITGFDVTDESAQMYNMPTGVYVSEVLDGGGAAKADVIKGSIITGFEGVGIGTMDELQAQLQYYKAGEKVKVTMQVPANRGAYEEKTVEITLGKNS